MQQWSRPPKRPRGTVEVATLPATHPAAGTHDNADGQLARLAARLVLQLSNTVRDHTAALQRCLILPAESPIIEAMLQCGP